jgi:choline dehydrogenase
MFLGYDLRPQSRGKVGIVSADYRIPPEISIDWMEHAQDRTSQVEILSAIRRIARSRALTPYCGNEIVPGETALCEGAVTEMMSRFLKPGLHANGTCRMGPDPHTNVVDSQLRVHGVRDLRVADASIMPTPVSGNTNGPAMMIGARAAEIILRS